MDRVNNGKSEMHSIGGKIDVDPLGVGSNLCDTRLAYWYRKHVLLWGGDDVHGWCVPPFPIPPEGGRYELDTLIIFEFSPQEHMLFL